MSAPAAGIPVVVCDRTGEQRGHYERFGCTPCVQCAHSVLLSASSYAKVIVAKSHFALCLVCANGGLAGRVQLDAEAP